MPGAWVSPTSQAAAHAILAALSLDPRPPPVRQSLFGVGDIAILKDDNVFGYVVAVGWPATTPSSGSSSGSGSGANTPTSSHSGTSSTTVTASEVFKDRANEKPDALPKRTYILDRLLYSSTASLTVIPESALLLPCAGRGETLRAFPKEFKKVFPNFEVVEIGVKKMGQQGQRLEYEYLIEARWGTEGEGKQEWVGAGEMEMLRGMG